MKGAFPTKYKMKGEVFLYFRLFFLIALSVVVLMGAVQYYSSYQELENNALRNGSNMLLLLENLHSSVMEQVDISVRSILDDSQFMGYMDYLQSGDFNHCRNIIERLRSLVASNAYLKSIYVYYINEEYTVSSDFGSSELEWFYDTEFIQSLENTPWNHNSVFRRTITSRYNVNIATGEVITQIRTLPVYSPSQVYDAYIVVNVDVSAISAAIKQINTRNSSMLVLDEEGNYIAGTGDLYQYANEMFQITPFEEEQHRSLTYTLNGNKVLIQSVKSPRGWVYIYVQPISEVMGGISSMRVKLLSTCAVALLLSVLLSMRFSKRAFEPLRMISDSIKAAVDEGDMSFSKETERILYQIDLIIARNRQLERERVLEKQAFDLSTSDVYPNEYENRLLLAIKSRNIVSVRRELDQLMLHTIRTDMKYACMVSTYKRLHEVVCSLSSSMNPATALDIGEKPRQTELDSALEEVCKTVIDSIQPVEGRACSALISDVKNYIDTHLSEDLRAENIAEKCYVSASYMRKVFKAETHMTFKEYIDQRRIAEAKMLLRDERLKIQEIAQQVGYPYTQSFIAFFRGIVGMTPGEFRAQLTETGVDSETVISEEE